MRKVIPDCQIMHAVVMRGPSSPNLEPEMLLKEIQEPLRHLVACQARRGDNVEAVVADLHLDYAAVFREEDVIRVLTATGGAAATSSIAATSSRTTLGSAIRNRRPVRTRMRPVVPSKSFM